MQVANQTLTISQAAGAAAGCEFTIDPTQASVEPAGGTVSVTVTRTNGVTCPWTAASNSAFISVQSGQSGTNNGTTVLAVDANQGAARTGTAAIAGRVITITQAAPPFVCVFSVTPTTVSMPAAGGTAVLNVALTSGSINCPRTSQSNSNFITVPNTTAVGPGSVTITVAANSGGSRTGTVTVAGQTITITQDAASGNGAPIAVLSYESDPGDFIGQGQSNTHTVTGSQFQVELNSSQSELRFSIPPSGGTWWNLWMYSTGGTLTPGTYNQAARASFRPAGAPGLDFFGSGRGCNRLTGRFLVQTAVFSGTSVQRFHARFEQHCEGWSSKLRGQIWIDAGGALPPALADFPVPPAQPTSQLTYTSDPGDFIGQGQSVSLALSGHTVSAWRDSSRPTVDIRWQSASGPLTTFWNLSFSAASGTQLQPGTYTGATRYPFNSGVHGLSVSGNGRGCNTLTGSFVVLEAVYGQQGEMLRFHATFEQHCEGAAPALRGEVRIVADPWR